MVVTTWKKTNILRFVLIGLLVFFVAGGISLYFLVRLGAAIFEIDPVLTGLPAGLAYPVFSIFVILPFFLFKHSRSMIDFLPLEKKEELICFIGELVSMAIGLVFIIVGANNADSRVLLSMIGFAFFYVPGIVVRLVLMIKKAEKNIKKIVAICVVFLLFIALPAAISIGGTINENYGLGYIGLIYILPLIALLAIGHKEDDIVD